MKTIVFFITFFSITTAFTQNNWELEKEKDGIKIWTRKRDNSKLKEYKGVMVIQTSVDKLLAVFKNIKNHEKFFYKCKQGSVSLVKKSSDNEFYTYMVLQAPIVKNRDAVTHFLFNSPNADGSVVLSLEAKPNLVPYKPDCVRVPEMKGYWKFTPKSDSTVEVIHQAYSSPGSGVPESLANLASVDAPYSMLVSLKNLIKK
jgi:hypothetical protein